MDLITTSVVALGAIGVIAAIVLYIVAKRFNVQEDPRIALIEENLPGANCGACGYNGCHDFAVNCSKAPSLTGFLCPGAGDAAMKRIGEIMGMAAESAKPMIAVVRCGGTCAKRPARVQYDGAKSCTILNSLGAGTTDCSYGCLGEGDCVAACRFGALSMDPVTRLPVINEEMCTACGMCVTACPRNIIELRAKGPRGLRVWVNCVNREKGPMAMKACKAACIACGKCVKACPHEAITIANNVSYIDFNKCKLCKKCVAVCPTGAIATANFPTPKAAPQPAANNQSN